LKGRHPCSEVTLQKSSFFEEHFYLIWKRKDHNMELWYCT
jgi:hypothetical protein